LSGYRSDLGVDRAYGYNFVDLTACKLSTRCDAAKLVMALKKMRMAAERVLLGNGCAKGSQVSVVAAANPTAGLRLPKDMRSGWDCVSLDVLDR
jgi:hypothetical protein